MKTTLNVLFVFVLAANSLFAFGNLKLNVLPVNDNKVIVYISSLTDDSRLSVSLVDKKGSVILCQENEVVGDDFCKVFNFSDLKNGYYRLKVICKEITSECLIQKTNDGIVVDDEMKTPQPFFCVVDNILKCSFLNYNKEDVAFYFYKNDEELFGRLIGKDFSIQQGLNLSKLGRGDYEAILTAGDKRFSYNIEIK